MRATSKILPLASQSTSSSYTQALDSHLALVEPTDAAHPVSDEALLEAYQGGDFEAFATLFERYRRPLFNFLLRRVRDSGRAEELYQDVWTKVVCKSEEFRGDSKFSTWMYSIARNRCIDHSRRMRFRAHASLDSTHRGAYQPLIDQVASDRPDTDALASASTLRHRIARAVEQLPVDQREVFLLRQLQGLAFHEIANIVCAPTNTVKSRMRYALENLRGQLHDLYGSD